MELNEETTRCLAEDWARGRRPVWQLGAAAARRQDAELAPPATGGPLMHTVDDDDVGVLVRRLRPTPRPPGVIVYFHGGGWVLGNLDKYDFLGRSLAAASGLEVVLVDYRKAPEHPHPAALADAWTAVQRIAASTSRPIAVAGDSAGGNLAAVLARRVRDNRLDGLDGLDTVRLQALIYPVTDADFGRSSYDLPLHPLLLTREAMQFYWDQYVPSADRTDPDVAPLRAPSLAGLPGAVVLHAEYDVLRDEGEEYERRLRAAGVPTTSRVFAGQAHGFLSNARLTASAEGVTWLAARISAGLGVS